VIQSKWRVVTSNGVGLAFGVSRRRSSCGAGKPLVVYASRCPTGDQANIEMIEGEVTSRIGLPSACASKNAPETLGRFGKSPPLSIAAT